MNNDNPYLENSSNCLVNNDEDVFSVPEVQISEASVHASNFGRSLITYLDNIQRTQTSQKAIALATISRRQEKLFDYLASLAEKEKIDVKNIRTYRNAWKEIAKICGDATPVPDADYGSDGEITYTLDSGSHHLEFEIKKNGVVEVFYRDRKSGLNWEDEYLTGDLALDSTKSKKITETVRLFRLF